MEFLSNFEVLLIMGILGVIGFVAYAIRTNELEKKAVRERNAKYVEVENVTLKEELPIEETYKPRFTTRDLTIIDEKAQEAKREEKKKQEAKAERIRNRNNLIYLVQEVHNVKCYDDIGKRLDNYYLDGKFVLCIELLEYLYNLNVDTGEILEERPYVWKACLRALSEYNSKVA